jgi:insulysin
MDFYDKHYSSNLMSLVLVGKESLDELQKLAIEHFTDIPNKKLPANNFSKEEVFNKEYSFGRICKIIPD